MSAPEEIEYWVTELSPIHETVARFEKGGHECGKTILELYTALCDAERSDLQVEVDDLQNEVDELKEVIRKLKKESKNGKV